MANNNDDTAALLLVILTVVGSVTLALGLGGGWTGTYWGIFAFCVAWVYLFNRGT